MSDDQKIRKGGCDCGAVAYEARGDMRDVVNCHCGQCRRTHGHVAAYATVPRENLTLTEDRGLKWYVSSDSARRGFCDQCGASLFWQGNEAAHTSIAAGTLQGETGLKTVAEIFVADAGDYYDLIPGLDHFSQSD